MTRTLIIEQGDGAREKEQSYNFMFEQRGNDVLALNTDTGVWKIDSSYSELLKIADTESQSIRIRCNDQIHDQLAEDKLIDHVSEETKYEEFSLLILKLLKNAIWDADIVLKAPRAAVKIWAVRQQLRLSKSLLALITGYAIQYDDSFYVLFNGMEEIEISISILTHEIMHAELESLLKQIEQNQGKEIPEPAKEELVVILEHTFLLDELKIEASDLKMDLTVESLYH